MENTPRILAGRYEIGETIGRGGMAEVYIGHDTRLGRTVAIKMLRTDLARDPAFQARFRREAQAAAALNHPAIVAVYDTGEEAITDSAGAQHRIPFIVMEYVEGHTVRDILRGGQPVPIDEAVEITSGVLSALEYSHRAGIVHRDIKPANIMITPTGAVKVMDFGIARAMADASSAVTQTQAVIGTAQYLSPEQARGETVDTRSDIYSAGCVLFELLTGRPPFVGDSPVSVAYQHVREAVVPPSSVASDIPEPLDQVTLKALAKDRETRYQSAVEFRADLDAFLAGRPISLGAMAAATQVMNPEQGTQLMSPTAVSPLEEALDAEDEEDEGDGKKKKTWIIWVVVGAVLAIIAIVLLILALNRDEEPAQVPVPQVVGLAEAEAKIKIEAVGLEFVREEAFSSAAEKGKVTKVDPNEGVNVDQGSEVTVTIGTGPDTVSVPNLTGRTQEQARALLEEQGLNPGNVSTRDTDASSYKIPADSVISTDPEADTAVKAGSTVNLIVSSGKVTVRSVVDDNVDDATSYLKSLGLEVSTTEVQDSNKSDGTVIEQSPGAGAVTQGSRVTLRYAKKPSTATVPNVVNQAEQDAESILGEIGFQVSIDRDFSDTVESGRVISTNPTAGRSVPYGSTVTILVSKGPIQPEVPGDGGNANNGLWGMDVLGRLEKTSLLIS